MFNFDDKENYFNKINPSNELLNSYNVNSFEGCNLGEILEEKKHTLDEYLDAYNAHVYYFKTFGDQKHKEKADEIMNKLKQGEYK